MKILQVSNIDSFVKSRRQKTSQKDRKIVQSILDDVRKNGDSAVKKYEQKFNGKKTKQLRISKQDSKNAMITKAEFDSLKLSALRLSKAQRILHKSLIQSVKKIPNVSFVPIPSVGCYIPGGQARYPSSAIMSVITAAEAGVKRIVVVSPPNSDGNIDPMTITVAEYAGAEIYKVGGAQAIAALAYGTKSIPKVDKIVGPGGKFVSIAKAIVSEETSIDMIAGPTELGIIVDSSADSELVAYDLVSQAEHSNDTMCFVITTSKTLAKQIQKSLEKLIPNVERSSIVKQSISKNGFIAVCNNQNDVIELANKIAPEHIELMVKGAKKLAKQITGPGLVLIGNNTPSSASDYLLGTNHILPTNGFGRTRGGLSVLDFLKLQTILETKKSNLTEISDNLKILTNAEGLPNHYKAVERRLK
ncbi:MAG: histidinol dehydrogenase [Candidatus Nitrosopelagicus sp.]|nr:histidinol dehydrogenase [Candidatus Nitrosopelagicus sp.]